MINLNSCQSKALAMVNNVIKRGQSMSLTGQAGTGKSTVTKQICNLLDSIGRAYKCCALTHKAAAVMSEITGRETATLHSTLRLAPSIDYKTGKEILKRTSGSLPSPDTLLVIDEGGMQGSELCAKSKNYQNITIGDPYQLAPIGEGLSPSLFQQNRAHLTQVMRHDNEILNLATALCECVKTGNPLPKIESQGTVEVCARDDFYEEYYCSLERDEGNTVYTAWTNNSVCAMIKRVRRTVFHKHPEIPDAGDVMVNNNTVIDADTNEVVLANNEYVTVVEVTEKEFCVDDVLIAGYQVVADGTDNVRKIIDVSIDKGAERHVINKVRAIAVREKTKEAWFDFFTVSNMFADLRFPYCSTVHKTQGSTFKNVFVDMPNIVQNKDADEVARLLYVACSRASERLVIRR